MDKDWLTHNIKKKTHPQGTSQQTIHVLFSVPTFPPFFHFLFNSLDHTSEF